MLVYWASVLRVALPNWSGGSKLSLLCSFSTWDGRRRCLGRWCPRGWAYRGRQQSMTEPHESRVHTIFPACQSSNAFPGRSPQMALPATLPGKLTFLHYGWTKGHFGRSGVMSQATPLQIFHFAFISGYFPNWNTVPRIKFLMKGVHTLWLWQILSCPP